MIKYKNINWKLYQKVLIPDVPPHIEVNLTKQETNELLEKTDVYFVRWTNEWDRKDGEFWYLIKDEKEDINSYKSKIRNQIRKGLKNCKIKKVTKEYIAKYGYEVYKNISKKWQKSVSNWAEIISQFGIIFQERLEPYLK